MSAVFEVRAPPLLELVFCVGSDEEQRHPEHDARAVVAGAAKRVSFNDMLPHGVHMQDALPIGGARRVHLELNAVMEKVVPECGQDLELTQQSVYLGRALIAQGDVASPKKATRRIGTDAGQKGEGHPFREACLLAQHMFDHGFCLPVYDHELANVGVIVERVVDQHAGGFVAHDRTA